MKATRNTPLPDAEGVGLSEIIDGSGQRCKKNERPPNQRLTGLFRED